jgi:hypothetical protein
MVDQRAVDVSLGGGVPQPTRVGELCRTAPRIEVSALGDESVALGAVRTALDHIDQEVFADLQL